MWRIFAGFFDRNIAFLEVLAAVNTGGGCTFIVLTEVAVIWAAPSIIGGALIDIETHIESLIGLVTGVTAAEGLAVIWATGPMATAIDGLAEL